MLHDSDTEIVDAVVATVNQENENEQENDRENESEEMHGNIFQANNPSSLVPVEDPSQINPNVQ
jgi:hypothetical protein